MTERIKKLADLTVVGDMYVDAIPTEYDRCDIFLPEVLKNAKRAKEYILNQEPLVNELTALTGFLRFRGDVHGDIFNREGHNNWKEIRNLFYNKPAEGTCTFEWQHSVADFEKVIKIGMDGYKEEIALSKKNHTEKEKLEFLEAIDIVADAIIEWAEKCSRAALAKAHETNDEDAKKRLLKLSEALENVPKKPAKTFFEAVLTMYITYTFVPDSIGCIDRYLYPFYVKDIADGSLTKEEAREYLQELFLMLQARIPIDSPNFYRGGEAHFSVGGYLENGEDGFNELSRLVLDSMVELPTWIPQVSLRWTKKTPTEVLRYVMDLERKDPNKRVAFVNDEPRIKALMERAGFPYEVACRYTMVGCNEPQLPGGIFMGGCTSNIAKCMEKVLYDNRSEIIDAKTFDEFYKGFEKSVFQVLERLSYWYENFQLCRSRDINIISSMFFEGSIERGLSITQGGAKNAVAASNLTGLITVVDSLSVIKQYVYDEKKISLPELLNALDNNWEGYEGLREDILSNGAFFGNGDAISTECVDRLSESIGSFLGPRKTKFGYSYLAGNLIGYNEHHKIFGNLTKATPDGRHNGDMISYGISQNMGKDREGITTLLSSVAKMNAHLVFCGPTVTNILIEANLVKNDANFEKLVMLMETYFKMGGLHFQLNYVSPEELRKAKANPQEYKSLRVRVSGFSDYFKNLNDALQDEIILRTEKESF